MARPFHCIHFLGEVRAELGGVVAAVLDLCQSMAERGHRVVLATCDASDVPADWSDVDQRRPEVVVVPPARFAGVLGREGIKAVDALLPEFDVAHLHTPWDLGNLQWMRLLRRRRKPYVVTSHGMLDHYSMAQKALKKRAFLYLGGRALFRHATTVHFTAQAEMDQALRYVPGGARSVVQACAIDLSPYVSLPGPEPALQAFPQIDAQVPKLLFLSRLHPKKGVDVLLRAAAILKRQGRRFQLLLAGPGEQRYIDSMKRLAASLDIQEAVHFLGMVRGVEKLSLYQLADAFVLPTRQENFGLVLAEAMACGTPVITTRGTDIWKELAQAGAKIVELNPESLATGIWEVVSDSDASRRLGDQGRDFVRRWLDPDQVAGAYESMYLDAIARGASPGVATSVPIQECTVGV